MPISSPKPLQQRVFELQPPVLLPKTPQQHVFEPQTPVLSPKPPHPPVFNPQLRVSDPQPPILNPKTPNPHVFDSQPPVSNHKTPSSPIITLPDVPTPPTPFNWADDASSLPILSSRPPPRDLSILRSPFSKPFSSLQHRNKRSRYPFLQPFQNFKSSSTPCQTFSRHSFPAPRFSSSPIMLNWDQDPRLSELSRVLKALGWIQPRRGRRF